jgi:fatty acid desaturase/membrane-associated phospholipid phosphatase
MRSLREKAAVGALMGAAAAVIYFGALHSSLYAALPMPMTFLDRMIPFVPSFVVFYLSFFLLILTPLFVIDDRQELRDAAFGFGLILVVSGIAFVFWPTAVVTPYRDPLLDRLLALDAQRNACPSLHASLAIYCALCAWRKLESQFARAIFLLWTVLVVASALLIKQHAAIDIAVGAALGVTVFGILFFPVEAKVGDSEPIMETQRIRAGLMTNTPGQIMTLTRHNLRKRIIECSIFVALAALGCAISVRAISVPSYATLAAGIVITAAALNAFPLMMHEGMHGLLIPNRRWNWIASVLLGATFLMSFSAYRVLHVRHHRHLGDARDPDDYHNYSRNRLIVWTLHFVRLGFGPLLYLFLIPVLSFRYGSVKQRKLICAEYTILLLIYSIMLRALSARALLLVWIAPLLLVGLFTAIRGFTQHGITDATDPYLASRTMLPHPVIAFFLLNENYHLEHHLFPEVPSYHLEALHKLIWPQVPRAVSGKSYLGFLAAFFKATPRLDETPIGLVHPQERL